MVQLFVIRMMPIFPAYNVPLISTILPHIYPPTKDPIPRTIVIDPAKILSFLSSISSNSIIYDE